MAKKPKTKSRIREMRAELIGKNAPTLRAILKEESSLREEIQ